MLKTILAGTLLLATACSFAATPAIKRITLQRMGCYGTCPVYSVTIESNGSVLFQGDNYVRHKGKARSTVRAKSWQFLISAFRQVGFFRFQDRYDTKKDGCKATTLDAPSLVITVDSSQGEKKVSYNLGCQGPKDVASLYWLADTIDIVSDSQQWVGSQ